MAKRSVKLRTAFLLAAVIVAGVAFALTRTPRYVEDLSGERMETPGSFEDEREGRGDWFYEQRAYPLQEIPRGARMRALEQLAGNERRRRFEGHAEAGGDPAGQPVWAAVGPAPISNGFVFGSPAVAASGRVTAIALDPRYNGTTNQTIYVGGAQSGVWRSTDNGANWSPIIDNEASLAIGAIAIDPTNPNIIYVGTGESNRSGDCYYGAGLLKSTDSGATWTLITGPVSTKAPAQPAFINAAIGQITIDPVTPATIFLATTIGTVSSATGNAASPPLGQVGIWKSSDSGATWKNVDPDGSDANLNARTQSGHDVLIDPLNHQVVYAVVRSRGIYRSTAGGEPGTWTLVAGGLPEGASTPNSPPFFRAAMAAGPPIAPSTAATLYAAFAGSDDELFGIWRSTDGGNNWTKLTTPSTSGQENYNIALIVDPTDANVVYYGTSANFNYNGGAVMRSKDGGQSWTDIGRGDGNTGGLHPDTHSVVVARNNRNILLTGNDGGIWRTDNALADPVAWATLNQNLSFTQFQSIALHPTNPALMIGGTQDNGTLLYAGSTSWTLADGGDGGLSVIDQSNPQVMYHTRFNQNNSGGQTAQIGPRISFNGGSSWSNRGCFGCTSAPGRFNPSDRVAFYPPLSQHTGFTGASGNVIYFGTHRLYRTADQGLTWTGLGASTDGFGTDLTKGTGRLSVIVSHPQLNNATNPPGEIVWTGSSDGQMEVTTSAGALAGATFTVATKAPLPNRYVSDIGLAANNTQRAVVTYSGFNASTPTTPGHVFQTSDQGTTWTDISGDLPDVPVSSVALDPNNANRIWIGTDLGVFETTSGGAAWTRLSNGMPKVATFMLRYHTATSTLVAATHGRGIYRLTTARATTTVSAANYSTSSVTSEGIVAAFGTGLATAVSAATALPLPTTLSGTHITVRDSAGVERLAPLFFVAPNQINYQIPSGTATGMATVTITSSDGIVSAGAVQINAVAPSIFTADSTGQGLAAASLVRVRGNVQTFEPVVRFDTTLQKNVAVPIDLGPAGDTVVLLLFGTGVRNRTALNAVTVTVGGANAEVQYASIAPGFVGLDQINLVLPRSLGNRGDVDVVMTVDGKRANPVRINIK